MAFSGKLALLLVLALLLAVTFGEFLEEDLSAEEVKALELSEEVRQEEGPPATGGDPEAQTPARGPQGLIPPSPKRTCGVFILCERQPNFFGAPGAELFKGETGTFFVKTVGSCKSFLVKGKCKRKTKRNHAKLWPVNNEEFDELCFYFEQKHACTSGTVQVIRRENGVDNVVHSCAPAFDAHTVRFCMYKNPNEC